jgi:hypothetical protein
LGEIVEASLLNPGKRKKKIKIGEGRGEVYVWASSGACFEISLSAEADMRFKESSGS